ncbi:MAG: four helix bundle protein [Gemmatimonadota bacterium]
MRPTDHDAHPTFTHRRLDVYHAALDFVQLAATIVQGFPRGHGHMADQLRRASISIPLNIAEGAGEFSARDKARFYRIARRSALECAAVMDLARVLGLAEDDGVRQAIAVLRRIVAMLTQLISRWGRIENEPETERETETERG